VSIYERLLSNETDDSDDMKHNLAILLNSHDSTDFDGRAYKIWKEVFLGSPTDFAIRKAFARYLMRHKKADDASRVLEGKPIQ